MVNFSALCQLVGGFLSWSPGRGEVVTIEGDYTTEELRIIADTIDTLNRQGGEGDASEEGEQP